MIAAAELRAGDVVSAMTDRCHYCGSTPVMLVVHRIVRGRRVVYVAECLPCMRRVEALNQC